MITKEEYQDYSNRNKLAVNLVSCWHCKGTIDLMTNKHFVKMSNVINGLIFDIYFCLDCFKHMAGMEYIIDSDITKEKVYTFGTPGKVTITPPVPHPPGFYVTYSK